jgi:hypothetical protein
VTFQAALAVDHDFQLFITIITTPILVGEW